jgi:hypothetical protein
VKQNLYGDNRSSPWMEISPAAAGMTAVGLCAASHIREGHQFKLREAGAVHLARSWDEVAKIAAQFLDGASRHLPA